MIIRLTCVSMVMVSGILLFAGCSFLADKPQGEANSIVPPWGLNQKVSLDRTETLDRTAPSSHIPNHRTR